MFINSETDYNHPEDEPFDIKKIIWYTVKANLSETKREQEEKLEAVKKQMAMGIIQANGLPAGVTHQMLGLAPPAPPRPRNFQQMLPQQRIQFLKQQQAAKPTAEQQFYSKFGIRK
jgi:hypothetical protein